MINDIRSVHNWNNMESFDSDDYLHFSSLAGDVSQGDYFIIPNLGSYSRWNRNSLSSSVVNVFGRSFIMGFHNIRGNNVNINIFGMEIHVK
tara:strand:+ start:253 stop:525 length:273 start_codon:yes stop_codon:yes gene_type:complete